MYTVVYVEQLAEVDIPELIVENLFIINSVVFFVGGKVLNCSNGLSA